MESISGSRDEWRWKILSYITGGNTFLQDTITALGIGEKPIQVCIVRYGQIIMGQYLKDAIYTILTIMEEITPLRTCSASIKANIKGCTPMTLGERSNQEKQLRLQLLKLQSGIDHQRELNGTKSMEKPRGKIKSAMLKWSAFAAARSILSTQIQNTRASFATQIANHSFADCLALITRIGIALCAIPFLSLTDILRKRPVVRFVRAGEYQKQEVYNLNVEHDHVYYANGILVFNCHDALQYLLLGFYDNLVRSDEDDYTSDMPKSASALGY